MSVLTCIKETTTKLFNSSPGFCHGGAPVFLLVLALCCRSTCQFRRNSEKSNHMLRATSHIELEFLTKFLNMSKLQNRLILLYQSLPLQSLWKTGELYFRELRQNKASFANNVPGTSFQSKTFGKAKHQQSSLYIFMHCLLTVLCLCGLP